jgi:DNA polymerase-3 subunit chi
MSEVRFYHLQRTSLETALPQMLERALGRGQRIVVMVGSAERVEALAHWLWTYDDRGFLPHGTARDGSPELQPIWLTEKDENPNSASVLFLTDGAASAAIDRYQLCVELFDGNDAAAVAAARGRWKAYKEAGHQLSYYQQDGGGRWEKRAG